MDANAVGDEMNVCVNKRLKKSLTTVISYNQKATWSNCSLKTGKECDYNNVHTQPRTSEEPPAVLQQEMYCRQHSCNNKAVPVLQGAGLHGPQSRLAVTAAMSEFL